MLIPNFMDIGTPITFLKAQIFWCKLFTATLIRHQGIVFNNNSSILYALGYFYTQLNPLNKYGVYKILGVQKPCHEDTKITGGIQNMLRYFV